RFGPLPDPVQAVLATVRIRIKASLLDISSIVIDPTSLVIRGTQTTNFDRADLYGRFGMAARIDRGVVRVPTSKLSPNKASDDYGILDKALALAHFVTGTSIPTTVMPREPVPARRHFPS